MYESMCIEQRSAELPLSFSGLGGVVKDGCVNLPATYHSEDTSSAEHGSPTKSEAPPKRAGFCGQLVVLFKREPWAVGS